MQTVHRSGHRTVRQAFLVYLSALGALWSVALLVRAVQALVFHKTYPYDTLLFQPSARFSDFTIFYPRFSLYGLGDNFFAAPGFPFTYPAPLLISFLGLWKLAPNSLNVYLFLLVAFVLVIAVAGLILLPHGFRMKSTAAPMILGATLLSFPLVFLLDRANLEGIVWMASSLGIVCFASRRYSAAVIFLALASSMKVFPVVLLLLFVAKKRYREAVLALVAVAAITGGSLWLAGPTFTKAVKGVAGGMDFLRRTQVLEFRAPEIGFDHSIFACVKQLAFRFVHDAGKLNLLLPRIYIFYAVFAVVGFGGLYLLRLRKMPVMNQLLALSALSVALPFVSYEYTLVHLSVPFIILVLFLVRDVASGRLLLTRGQMLALLLPYSVAFAPLSYLLYHGFGFGGQIQALTLVALVAAASSVPLPSTIFGELDDRMRIKLKLSFTQIEKQTESVRQQREHSRSRA